jgi:hypothetical protein
MAKTISTDDLNKLLEQVAGDVETILAKANEDEVSLVKASPGQEAPGEETPAGSSSEGSEPEGSPEGSPESAEPPGGEAGEAQGEQAPPQAGSPEGSDEQTQNPATDESGGPEALVAEYAKLPIEELKMHVMAAHEALMQAIGTGDGSEQDQPGMAPEGAAPEGTPPPGAAPEGTPEGAQEPPMGKKEIKASPGSGGEIKKSEVDSRIEKLEKALTAKNEEFKTLEAKFDQAATGLQKFVERATGVGLRKSIAGISEIGYQGKPGTESTETVTLSKSEAIAQLNDLTRSDIKKSDREAINKYVIGAAPISTVAHLLKKQ